MTGELAESFGNQILFTEKEVLNRNGHLSSRTALRVKPEVYHRKSGTSGRSIIGSGGAGKQGSMHIGQTLNSRNLKLSEK